MKRLLSIIMALLIMLTSLPAFTLSTSAAQVDEGIILGGNSAITRAQWLHNLVDAFDMYVEDEAMPDNYFTDLSTSHRYYRDIIMAVEFGVVNIPAGEELKPDDPVNRDFATSTLNFCLGYQLEEGREYTFTDYELCSDPDSAQIALDRGWVSLNDTMFCPDLELTDTEIKAMMNDAASVLEGQIVDPDYESTYTYAEDVLVIPDGTDVTEDENGNIVIANCDETILVGDKFAVYMNGIPNVYTAEDVAYEDNKIVVAPEVVSVDDAFEEIDAQGVLDTDAMEIIPAQGVEVSIEDDLSGASTFAIAKIKKTIEAKVEVPFAGLNGSVSVSIENPYVDYSVSGTRAYVALCGDATITYEVSGSLSDLTDTDSSISLFYVNIAGIGGFDVDLNFDISGSLSGTVEGQLTAGVECQKGSGIRVVKSFVQKSFYSNAEVSASVSLKASLGVTKMPVVEAYIYAEVGMKCSFSQKNYKDGSTPKQCSHFGAYLFARVGATASAKFGMFSVSESATYDIYHAANSPVRIAHHYEDKIEVPKCTRGGTYGYYTNGYSRWGGCGWMGANGAYGLNADGTPFKLYNYTLDDDDKATITRYNGNSWSVYIPKEIDGYTVVGIGNNAFINKDVGYVDIPETVISIGNGAFSQCYKLRTVNIPDSVTHIGTSAFYQCSSLGSVSIPSSLESILYRSFSGCSSLKSVTIPNKVTEIGNEAFAHCSSLKEVNLSKSLTHIGWSAFREAPIESIEIPKSLDTCYATGNFNYDLNGKKYSTYFGPFAFCENLKNVTFEKGTTQIASYLFAGCVGLEKITIPDTVTVIEQGAFESCLRLNDVTVGNSVTTISSTAFKQCVSLPAITLPDSLTKIEYRAFENCESLASVEIPDNVTEIGYEAFAYCSSLKEVKLSKSLTHMGWSAFRETPIESIEIPKSLETCDASGTLNYEMNGTRYSVYFGPFAFCEDLKNVTFEKGTTQIASYLFAGCVGLEKITIPDTVTVIKQGAFESCLRLSNVTVGNSVTTISSTAFKQCIALQKIELPNSVKKIDYRAFLDCKSLASIDIPNSVTEIEYEAFAYCSSLKEVNLSKSLTHMGWGAFREAPIESIEIPKSLDYCDGTGPNTFDLDGIRYSVYFGPFAFCKDLKNVTFEEGTTQIASYLLAGCVGLEKITIPDTVTVIEQGAFESCLRLNDVTVGNSVTTIANSAFTQCVALPKITLPVGLTKIDYRAFLDCKSLVSVDMPSSVQTIGYQAFRNCSSLKSIALSSNVECIDTYTFEGCTSLESFSFPEDSSLKEIRESAFSGCSSLKEADIPFGTSNISNNAFKNCVAMEKVTIPRTVKTIGSQAFMGCENLKDVIIADYSISEIKNDTFKDCPSINKIVLPKGLTKINSQAFRNCTSLFDISIPESVTTINADAFSYPEKTTIRGRKGSFAETFANDNGFKFADYAIPAEGIILKGDDDDHIDIEVGETYYAEFEFYPEDANDVVTLKTKNSYININGHDIIGRYSGDTTVTATTTGGMEYEFTVHVRNVKDISIIKNPDKTTYLMGESFESTGMEVQAVYNDGFTRLVSDYSISGFDSSKEGKNTITVKWTAPSGANYSKTLELTIVDPAPKLTGIFIDTEPTKTAYELREKLDLTGMVVKGIYTDDSEKEITDYTTSGYNALKKGTQTITVAYEGFTDTFTVTVGITPTEPETKPTEPEKPDLIIGDVDGDGSVTILDATMIQMHMAELIKITDERFVCADTDKDSSITILDATRIQMLIAELIPEF